MERFKNISNIDLGLKLDIFFYYLPKVLPVAYDCDHIYDPHFLSKAAGEMSAFIRLMGDIFKEELEKEVIYSDEFPHPVERNNRDSSNPA